MRKLKKLTVYSLIILLTLNLNLNPSAINSNDQRSFISFQHANASWWDDAISVFSAAACFTLLWCGIEQGARAVYTGGRWIAEGSGEIIQAVGDGLGEGTSMVYNGAEWIMEQGGTGLQYVWRGGQWVFFSQTGVPTAEALYTAYKTYFSSHISKGARKYRIEPELANALNPYFRGIDVRKIRIAESSVVNGAITDCYTIYFERGSDTFLSLRDGLNRLKDRNTIVHNLQFIAHEFYHVKQCQRQPYRRMSDKRRSYALMWFGQLGVEVLAEILLLQIFSGLAGVPTSLEELNTRLHDSMLMERQAHSYESYIAQRYIRRGIGIILCSSLNRKKAEFNFDRRVRFHGDYWTGDCNASYSPIVSGRRWVCDLSPSMYTLEERRTRRGRVIRSCKRNNPVFKEVLSLDNVTYNIR